jgi:hypothetical protein
MLVFVRVCMCVSVCADVSPLRMCMSVCVLMHE